MSPWCFRFCAYTTRVFAGLALLWLAGCGSSGPRVEFVEGVILLDGKPVESAVVSFSPEGSAGLPAMGMTDRSGIFRLTTIRGGRPGKGAVMGDYVVTATKAEIHPDDLKSAEAAGRVVIPRFVIPERYSEIATSPLRATVKKGVNRGDAFRFDLPSGGAK
jgi:hypothetical protein